MKKFLLVVTLVGVVISQIFFSSLAEAYSEGDKLYILFCNYGFCNKKALVISLNGSDIRDDRYSSGYCPQSTHRREHFWVNIGARGYVYRNGKWFETSREGQWFE